MESSTAFLNGDILGSSHITTGAESVSGNIAPSIKKLNTGLFIFLSMRLGTVGANLFTVTYDGVDITNNNAIAMPNVFTGGVPYLGNFCWYVPKCDDSSKSLDITINVPVPGPFDAFAVSYAYVSNVPKNQIYKECVIGKGATKNITSPSAQNGITTLGEAIVLSILIGETSSGWSVDVPMTSINVVDIDGTTSVAFGYFENAAVATTSLSMSNAVFPPIVTSLITNVTPRFLKPSFPSIIATI